MFLGIISRTTNPILSCRSRHRTASERRVYRTVLAEVVFVPNSFVRSSIKITANSSAKPTVDVITVLVTVGRESGTFGTPDSSNVNKLIPSASVCTRNCKQVVFSERRANVISIIDFIGRKVTSGSPVSGDISNGLHTGHWQAVVVPFGCILVDWHVVQIEGFLERILILQGVRLDQGPRETRFRIKVTVNWEWVFLLVHNVVDTIGFDFFKQHDVFTGSRRKRDLAPVSSVTWRTCAVESSFFDVTHFTTSASMLTGGSLTAKVVTDLFRARLARNSL